MKLNPVWSSILLVLISLAFQGCAPEISKGDGGPVEIVFKHAKISGTTYLTSIVEEFEREHPGIRVREEILPSNSDDQHQFYAINLPAGAADFDVVDMDVIWVPEFARAGWLAG